MEIATKDFKKYLLDTYRYLPDDIEIISDDKHHFLNDRDSKPFIIYIYEHQYQEYSYALLSDIEWSTIFHDKENAA